MSGGRFKEVYRQTMMPPQDSLYPSMPTCNETYAMGQMTT